MRLLLTLSLGALTAVASAFAAPENPVTNGSFESVDAEGFPTDWSIVLQSAENKVEVTRESRTGKNALRLRRAVDQGEVGFNRAWQPYGGQQGKMLSQRKGGLVWRYKAVSAEGAHLRLYAIPMNDEPIEGTGAWRATFEVPESHVGDGQWHRAALAYDFTDNEDVKWVHVSGRIVGGTGELLLDDVEYVDSVGPLPKVLRTELVEPGKTADRLALTARIENAGDSRGDVEVGVELPVGLSVAGGEARKTLVDMPVGDRQNLTWQLDGNRDTLGQVRLYAKSGDNEAVVALPLQPEMAARALKPGKLILSRGEQTTLACHVENTGHANLRNVFLRLSLDPALAVTAEVPLTQTLELVPPGQTVATSWPVQAIGESVGAQARVEVRAEGHALQTAANELVVTSVQSAEQAWPEPAGKVNLAVVSAGAVIENGKLRAEFPRSSGGFGPVRLHVRTGTRWQQVGVVPRLAKATHLTNKQQRETLHFLGQALIEDKEGKPTLTLLARARDADRLQWTVRQQWQIDEDADTFQVFTHCYAPRPRKLLAFETLVLYAGAGSFGDKKTDALFPGLEWLAGDEVSSSDLDIAADHPHRQRFVPHVNKITIPLMSVHQGNTTVALLWDANEKWDGTNTRPGAVFCSPDHLEGRPGHLMGMILPTCPQWLDENTREAARPYTLTPKGALALHTRLYLDSSTKDSLSAMDKWFELYGVPDSLPPPRGDLAKELDFSAQSYLDSLWVPEERGWYSSRFGPKPMETIAPHGTYLYDVLMAERHTQDDKLRVRLRQRAEEARAAGAVPAADDYGITYGDPFRSLEAAAGAVAGLLGTQRDDGSWRFNANQRRTGVFEGMDYTELGTHDAAELGTCARSAYVVLRFARTTGDARALARGEKALAFMRRFTIPRAAQVWEVPVHTPDILAAADACEAYLTGYECTGKREYLAEAVRWARAGLPFLYAYNAPEYPFMRYGSIPVFGATWFRGSWFGRPVQWNGLRYAYALNRLAGFDRSFPWAKVAHGVMVSAMYQQSTDAEDLGLWPDSISCEDATKSGWIFAPRHLLRSLYQETGRDEEPWTQAISVEDGEVRLSGRGKLSRMVVNGDTIAFSLEPPPNESVWLLAAGLQEPAAVRLSGELLARSTEPALPDSPCYRHDANLGLLAIRLPAGAESNLLLTGVRTRQTAFLPEPVAGIDFDFTDSTEGWLSAHDLTPVQARGGQLIAQVTGGDPFLVRSFMTVPGKEEDVLELVMTVTAGEGGTVYWTTTDSPGFAEDKALRFPLAPGGQQQTYRVHVGTHPLWRDHTVTALRIDPGNLAASADVAIDSVRRLKLGE